MTRESVLICTYSAGYGHHKVSEALREAFAAIDPAVQVHIADPLKLGRPYLNSFLTYFYLELLKRVPFVYRALYRMAERAGSGKALPSGYSILWRVLINGACLKRIGRLMEETRPKMVICAHPFAAVAISRWRDRQDSRRPAIAGVITDFTIHPFWNGSGLDGYFVAAHDLVSEAAYKGMPRDRVWAVGIPVDKRFTRPYDKRAARMRLGLCPDRKTVLVMGGGLGMGDIGEVVTTVGVSGLPLQIIVVAGLNGSLQQRLAQIIDKLTIPVKVFSFVDNVFELMGAADAVITKPGGVTVAEAMACRLPIIIWRPIPGQEERNASYLVNRGLAVQAGSPDELILIVSGLENLKPGDCCRMGVLHKTAAQNVAEKVINLPCLE